jgi:hypothetical protein
MLKRVQQDRWESLIDSRQVVCWRAVEIRNKGFEKSVESIIQPIDKGISKILGNQVVNIFNLITTINHRTKGKEKVAGTYLQLF